MNDQTTPYIPKFNMGQEIFMVKDNEVKSGEIFDIMICHDNLKGVSIYYSAEGIGADIPEYNIFGSKDECVKAWVDKQ